MAQKLTIFTPKIIMSVTKTKSERSHKTKLALAAYVIFTMALYDQRLRDSQLWKLVFKKHVSATLFFPWPFSHCLGSVICGGFIICSVIAEWLNFSLCKKYHIAVYNRRKLCAMQKLPEKRISRGFHEWEKRARDTLARVATESEATQVKQG